MNYVGPNNLSLKYQRFTPSDCQDIEIRQFEFVTKTQFLYISLFFSSGKPTKTKIPVRAMVLPVPLPEM